MRTGTNPLKRAEAPESFPPVVATVITHIPVLAGYHARRLEIVQACLTSMRNFGGYPVLVWDNGSGEALRNWLVNEYRPETLVLSPNIGKQSARAAIARMLPAETIAGFSDDDMLFYPGWMDAHLALLRGFPNVGMVSGWPMHVSFAWGTTAAVSWAENNAIIERGRFISEEEEIDYARSVGLDAADHLKRTADMDDIRIRYHGLTAYAEAQHCQFVSRARVIAPFTNYIGLAMGNERDFDNAVDQAGLLRLTTTQRYTLHMGNVIDEALASEMARMGL